MPVKNKRFTTSLPATPCTEVMRAKILNLAEEQEVSLAQLQRSAFNLFLSTQGITQDNDLRRSKLINKR